jgi:hypothetical protein
MLLTAEACCCFSCFQLLLLLFVDFLQAVVGSGLLLGCGVANWLMAQAIYVRICAAAVC